jgi:hypothetical protein
MSTTTIPTLPKFLVELMETFRTGSVQARHQAGKQLLAMGPAAQEAIVPLLGYLDHSDPYTRLAAIELLALIGPPALPAVLECLHEEEPGRQQGACLVLGMMGHDALAAVPVLESLKNPDLAPWVQKALASIRPHRVKPRFFLSPQAGLVLLLVILAFGVLALAGYFWMRTLLYPLANEGEVLCAFSLALLAGYLGGIVGASRWGRYGALAGGMVLGAGGALAGFLLGGVLLDLVHPIVQALGG